MNIISIAEMPQQFSDTRCLRRYVNFINQRYSRVLSEDTYTENHHIIPRCLKGGNEESNLIILSAREHYIAHLLLFYAYPRVRKVRMGLFAMWGLKKKRKLTSRQFQVIREAHFKYYRGKNHHCYGTKLTEEHKRKIGEAGMGRVHKERSKKLIGKANKGNRHTSKTKRIMTEAKIGNNFGSIGRWHIPNEGYFCSAMDVANNSGLSRSVVNKYCRSRNHIPLTRNSYEKSSFLRTLGSKEFVVGKTPRELGFYVELNELGESKTDYREQSS